MQNAAGKTVILMIVACSIAMFMAALDGTIINVSLPVIAQDFGLTTSGVAWVSTIYLLVSSGMLLIIGKIADTLGYKKMFLIGFAVFTFGSFSCGFFPTLFNAYPLLLISRVIQAFGGAIMTVIAPALIGRYMPGDTKAKGMSVAMLFASIGMALGPTLGGLITETLSWSWIFFINIPVGIFAVILGIFVLPKDTAAEASMKGFDGVGAALVFTGLASLLFAVSEGSTLGWTSAPVLITIALAVLGIGGFIIRELRFKSPILDIRLFKNPVFLIMNIIFCLTFFIFAGANYLMPFFLQEVKGISTFNSGLLLTALSIGLVIAGLISGMIFSKLIGKIRILLIAGGICLAFGFFLLTELHPMTGFGLIIAGLVLIGLGIGFITTPMSTLLLQAVSSDKQGMVSSLVGLERQAPMAVGVTVFNLLLIIGVKYIAKHEGITTMPPHEIQVQILATGMDFCFCISVILAIVIIILCFFIRENRL
ncbi:MAG TPA: DHA2 family efflux MFS transporter permease subunit [Methanocorpusculum sp.]|nr:DHA2 family efflux MFS transporter permease subunit [Methanocorpusculum sp.]